MAPEMDVTLPFGMPVRNRLLDEHALWDLAEGSRPRHLRLRLLSTRLHRAGVALGSFGAGQLLAAAVIHDALRAVWRNFCGAHPGSLERGLVHLQQGSGSIVTATTEAFVRLYACGPATLEPGLAAREASLLWVAAQNPALAPAMALLDESELRSSSPYARLVGGLKAWFGDTADAQVGAEQPLFDLLLEPQRASPGSLDGQLAYVHDCWAHLLPVEMLGRLQRARDIHREETAFRGGGPGPTQVPRYDLALGGPDPEPEAFSQDKDWMANVVLLAKSTYVWLDQLSRSHGRPITRLDEIPDEELDRLATWGFTGLWLIGLWERSSASAEIKRRMGNSEAVASAYSLYDYAIAGDLGGDAAWEDLSRRAGARGIRLAADMVPNHVGLDSRWVVEHPDWFLSLDSPPYPGYRFDGPDLCEDERVGVYLESGYWDRSDAAVVFARVDQHTGDRRFIYHGNDGTHMPWNDTAQLDYLNPDAREAVIRTIVAVARRFPIIRFDAAMTLARRHVRRLWYPPPGEGGAIPSRAERSVSTEEFDARMPNEFWREVVDRVAAEAPDTLLLAEAFWLMEGYFVRTLGMHRVYNSAFMNMLMDEENAKYRATIRNVLEFSPEVLKRFVNFQNNPDEEPAVVQFGSGDKYIGVALMMVTMPGLPMFGHGQVEGFAEKYGMEYKRAYWDESPDGALVRRHEREIFPLMRRRYLFSPVENFALYDVVGSDGSVAESIFAWSNRTGRGDAIERALVLYNNQLAAASGRIHLAAAVNVARGDETRLVRRSLVEGLSLRPEQSVLYRYREHMSGLEFLRRGDELASGFAVSLSGYQSQVFVDFEELYDASADWRALADSLGGEGVRSLDEALEDRRAAPARAALAEACAAAAASPQEDHPSAATAAVLEVLLGADDPLLRPRHLAAAAAAALGDPHRGQACALVVHAETFAALLDASHTFLLVNEHEEIHWFNQERMETLIEVWGAVDATRDTEPLLEAVEASSFQLRLLESLLAPPTDDHDGQLDGGVKGARGPKSDAR